MFATWAVPVLPVSTSVAGSDVSSRDFINGNDVVNMQTRRRVKRIPMSSHLAIKGAEIVNMLLRGTTKIPSKNGKISVFTKPGSFATAINEFKALKPINIQSSNKWVLSKSDMVSGMVGDRLIVIERRGTMGKPTMSILREKDGVYDRADKIIYTDDAPIIGSRRADDFVDRRKSNE